MMKLLIANWKAYVTLQDIMSWLAEFKQLLQRNTDLTNAVKNKELTILICPSFIHIPYVKDELGDIPEMVIGSQTVSPKKEGKYTGEVTAKALKDYISYAIIGHSERRTNFPVQDAELQQQVDNCKQHTIEPILCVRNETDKILSGVSFVAYEPVEAIGSGNNADVADVLEMKKKLALQPESTFIYGGSVDAKNVSSYLKTGEVNGFLVGTASLKAASFYELAVAMI